MRAESKKSQAFQRMRVLMPSFSEMLFLDWTTASYISVSETAGKSRAGLSIGFRLNITSSEQKVFCRSVCSR